MCTSRRLRARHLAFIAAIVLLGAPAPAAAAGGARHFEQVSPADKGQGDIVADGMTTVAARSGDAVAFNSRTPFGDTIGSGVSGQTQYIARRTDSGWTTHAITPTPQPDAQQVFFTPTRIQLYSDDLRNAVVRAYDLPAVTGDTPLRNNIYVEDTATRALEPVTVSQAEVPAISDFLSVAVWGVSEDTHHVSFVAHTRYLTNAAPEGAPNVYQWDNGVLSLAGILPDGEVPSGGSDIIPELYRGAMSADGTRLLFTASSGGNPQLYQRIDGNKTVQVSQTQLDPSSVDPPYDPDPVNVALKGMTPDGHTVFFTTDSPLVQEDKNGTGDLYRFKDGNLTMISHDGTMGPDSELAGMSDDGERAYYTTSAANLWAWDHGTNRRIVDSVTQEPNLVDHLAVTTSVPGLSRATPDGRYLAFAVRDLTDPDVPSGPTNGHLEMYLYSLTDDTLRCVSCPSGPATSDMTVRPEATNGSPEIKNIGFRPKFLSDNGRVYFSTAEALAPQDTSGVTDAYEYDPATQAVKLLSTGRGSDGAWFTDASANGEDVFLATRQPLQPGDHDHLVDLYDAREGSTLPPEPEPDRTPACDGDSCQPPPSAAPAADLPGSLLFNNTATTGPHQELPSVRPRAALRGPAGTLQIQLHAPGRLAWNGKGLQSGSVRRSGAGPYRLKLRLGEHARAQLRATGTYRTSLRLTFVSADGTEVHLTTRLTFTAAAKNGR